MIRMLRLRDVQEITGLPVSSIYAMKAEGRFPKNIKLSANRVAWISTEVEQWMYERINAARGVDLPVATVLVGSRKADQTYDDQATIDAWASRPLAA